MKVVDQKEEGLKEKLMVLKEEQKGLKGAHSCSDYMGVFGNPRPNYAQLRRDDRLQDQGEGGLVKRKAEEEVAILLPLHPAEPGATWPPEHRYYQKNSSKSCLKKR